MESGNVHTYVLNNQMRDLLFHSFYFLIFWLLVFDNLQGLNWASYLLYKMCMKEENNRKETI